VDNGIFTVTVHCHRFHGFLASNVGIHLFGQLFQPPVRHDVIPIKNLAGFMPADLHGFLLAEARLNHVR
jgi:hypothetical protein